MTYALLDNCATNTLLREDLPRDFGFEKDNEPTDIKGVTGIKKVESQVVFLEISSTAGKNTFQVETYFHLKSLRCLRTQVFNNVAITTCSPILTNSN